MRGLLPVLLFTCACAPEYAVVDGVPYEVVKVRVVDACEQYVDRVEQCSAVTVKDDEARQRIDASLEGARASWRRAARSRRGREILATSCSDALRLYEASTKAVCATDR